jgi:hypothetical protein
MWTLAVMYLAMFDFPLVFSGLCSQEQCMRRNLMTRVYLYRPRTGVNYRELG